MNEHQYFLADEQATEAFGKALAEFTQGKGLITLKGDLGTGKTTLSRGLIRALGHTGAVKSPTYTLVEPYDIGCFCVMHYDLYRMEDPEELEFLGIRDFINDNTLSLIEWPEKAGDLLPEPDLSLSLNIENRGREIRWHSNTNYGHTLNQMLQDRYSP